MEDIDGYLVKVKDILKPSDTKILSDYESLDQSLFTKNLRKNYSDFGKYVKLINKYLK